MDKCYIDKSRIHLWQVEDKPINRFATSNERLFIFKIEHLIQRMYAIDDFARSVQRTRLCQ